MILQAITNSSIQACMVGARCVPCETNKHRSALASSDRWVSIRKARIASFRELHTDLFSGHAGPLEVYTFVAVATRDDVMSNEICRRFNGKKQ